MNTVLIVSRTQMSHGVCVGGIVEETNEFIRLHTDTGGNLPTEAPYQIGDRWHMLVEPAWNARPKPHVEDRQTTAVQYLGNVGMQGVANFIGQHCSITEGCITRLFNHTLQFSGHYFLTGSVGKDHVPNHSVAFWVADNDLMKHDNSFQGKPGVYYLYGSYRIKYVGFQTPLDCIPQGTVLRMSLANWWKKGDSDEERCYLQLSGWYI